MSYIAQDNSASPRIARRRLGHELRQLREELSLRLEDVAAVLNVAPSTLSRIETGKAPARTSYLTVALDHYGVTDPDRRRELADQARHGQRKGWWTEYRDVLPAGAEAYLGLEGAAGQVEVFSAQVVPALLATSAYTAAACQANWPDMPANQIGQLAEIQQRRREILGLAGTPVHVIIDESALSRSICSASVLAAQLEHLDAAADDTSVTIQVAALAASWPVLTQSFTLLTFPGPDDHPAACYRAATGKIVVTEHQEQVSVLSNTFSALARAALSPAESARLINGLIRRQTTARP
jgi:transcriptional regulator with XRE-family HTH domain